MRRPAPAAAILWAVDRRLLAALALAVSATACTSGTGDDGAAQTTTPADVTAGAVEETPAPPDTAPQSTAAPTTTLPDIGSLPLGSDGAPAPPATATEALARILAVEDALRAGEPAVAGLGHHHQVLYREVNRHPEWLPTVLGAVDDATAVRISTILEAGGASAATVSTPIEAIPAWTIRPPRQADELLAAYRAAETETGVPWSVLAAINFVETRMGRIQGTSSANAQGPMQFLPSTWDAYGEGGDIADDGDAIAAAARLLASTGAPDDLAGAVYAYNHSDSYVASVLAYHQVLQADPWLYEAFHGWQVYINTVAGLLWLEEGFSTAEPVPLEPVDPEPEAGSTTLPGGGAAGSGG